MGVLVLWYFSAWDKLGAEDEAEGLHIDEGRDIDSSGCH